MRYGLGNPTGEQDWTLSTTLYDGTSPVGYGGYVRVVSAAYLAKTQIHLYREEGDEGYTFDSPYPPGILLHPPSHQPTVEL